MLCCEIDPECQTVLKSRFKKAIIETDIRSLSGYSADIVTGGWPCQDISVAGLRQGLKGKQSGLFFDLLRVAKDSGCHTIIAENVPNLLHLENGGVFREVLEQFSAHGFPNISWRLLNARWFGLPHNRNRIFIVASKQIDPPVTLHRKIELKYPNQSAGEKSEVSSFYWTAGSQSICYSNGYTPTLKVGSSLSIPSPPALHYNGIVRLLKPEEALRLQGFSPEEIGQPLFKNLFGELPAKAIYRMAGNAVAVPVGKFVMDGVMNNLIPKNINKSHFQPNLFADLKPNSEKLVGNGISYSGEPQHVRHDEFENPASNLKDFIDWEYEKEISTRAANGLLKRLKKSGLPCPESLLRALQVLV